MKCSELQPRLCMGIISNYQPSRDVAALLDSRATRLRKQAELTMAQEAAQTRRQRLKLIIEAHGLIGISTSELLHLGLGLHKWSLHADLKVLVDAREIRAVRKNSHPSPGMPALLYFPV